MLSYSRNSGVMPFRCDHHFPAGHCRLKQFCKIIMPHKGMSRVGWTAEGPCIRHQDWTELLSLASFCVLQRHLLNTSAGVQMADCPDCTRPCKR